MLLHMTPPHSPKPNPLPLHADAHRLTFDIAKKGKNKDEKREWLGEGETIGTVETKESRPVCLRYLIAL